MKLAFDIAFWSLTIVTMVTTAILIATMVD